MSTFHFQPVKGQAREIITAILKSPEVAACHRKAALELLEDGGVPFNPLEQQKPDTGLSWKNRRIGGLGIFLVRRKVDDVRYVYENGKNVLTIEKVI